MNPTPPSAGKSGPPRPLAEWWKIREDYIAGRGSTGVLANRYGISITTVRSHIQHIYEKLQVHTRTEAVAKFLKA